MFFFFRRRQKLYEYYIITRKYSFTKYVFDSISRDRLFSYFEIFKTTDWIWLRKQKTKQKKKINEHMIWRNTHSIIKIHCIIRDCIILYTRELRKYNRDIFLSSRYETTSRGHI